MTDTDARALLAKYSTSLYFREGGLALASVRPPKPTPDELVAGQAANVEEAKQMRDRVRARFHEAHEDGIFDTDMIESVGPRVQEKWMEAIDVLQGDRVRCIAELRHWREYYAWAIKVTRGKLKEREPGEDDDA